MQVSTFHKCSMPNASNPKFSARHKQFSIDYINLIISIFIFPFQNPFHRPPPTYHHHPTVHQLDSFTTTTSVSGECATEQMLWNLRCSHSSPSSITHHTPPTTKKTPAGLGTGVPCGGSFPPGTAIPPVPTSSASRLETMETRRALNHCYQRRLKK